MTRFRTRIASRSDLKPIAVASMEALPKKFVTAPSVRTSWSYGSVRAGSPRAASRSTARDARSTRDTVPRITAVRRRLVRSGVEMCVGSSEEPATSASIGVKRSAFTSDTRVSWTDLSAPSSRSSSCAQVDAGEAAAEDDDAAWRGDGAPAPAPALARGAVRRRGEESRERAERRAEEDERDERGKEGAHLSRGPARRVSAEERQDDHREERPEGNPERGARHERIRDRAVGAEQEWEGEASQRADRERTRRAECGKERGGGEEAGGEADREEAGRFDFAPRLTPLRYAQDERPRESGRRPPADAASLDFAPPTAALRSG